MGNKWDTCTCFELVRSVLSGHTEAFGVLYARTAGYVKGVCFHVSHNIDTAEDLMSQTYLHALEKLSYYQHDGQNNSFRRWMSRVALNISIDFIKKTNKRNYISNQMPQRTLDREVNPLLAVQALEQNNIIKEAVKQLPGKVGECIVSRYIHGHRNKAICHTLSLTENQVEYYLDMGRTILSKKLKKLL